MDISSVILGVGAGTIFLISTLFLYKSVKNFEENSETALTKLFLKKRVQKAFKVLTLSYIILGGVLAAEVAGFVTGNDQLQNVARAVAFLPMLGMIYFYHTVMSSTETKKQSSE